ncbi:AAA family ATPase [Deinococcus humi]|uniref:ORC1/DEAH AAA+ ATPase domain-containing protein n=1 Tax=Deinococcus humi TaxID=662880 RepID=A0A7W8JWJ4_9DEIO|nr:AAA family ATPase [Deinococcus humi]MBB5363056.1 hypothetical protein [Deinococcus humi]GGO24922.1 hypothetical protein GCM10008949_14290 [Deinococcus humi]
MKPAKNAELQADIEPVIDLKLVPVETPAPAPTVYSTPAVRLVLSRIDYAVKIHSPLCVISGEHGGGKSTAAKLYAQSNPRALYWEVPPEYDAREVVADLCQRLRISAGEAWRVRTSVLIQHLKQQSFVILLDESQRLNYRAMDVLKYIADQSQTTVVMLGSPWLDRMVDRHSDIASRAWVRGRVQPIELTDLAGLLGSQGYNPKTLAAVHGATGGVMRRIMALLDHLDEGLKRAPDMTRADLTPEHVRKVASEVLS